MVGQKVREFVAHAGVVNCVHLGRKSGQVLCTGGEDKKVNVWKIDRQNAVMSLSGHTSAVECVTFDSNEQTVIAGSAGGTLKLWDLEQAKVARTLPGHRSNCISVQWHPYGEFFASGSIDTNLKIWDLRRKTCIQTYKGHTRGVRQIIFSPDGRWVVSGGDDGVVKLWDLTMGRLVHEFTQHSAPISALAIHPTEFLMASASQDRTLRIWDLESFEQVSCTPPESGGSVRKCLFSDDGAALLSGGEESLRVWGWEPVRCYDQSEIRWNRLADMCLAPSGQQLLAASTRDAMVTIWDVSLEGMKPFSTLAAQVAAAPPPAAQAAAAPPSPVGRVITGGGAFAAPSHASAAGPEQNSASLTPTGCDAGCDAEPPSMLETVGYARNYNESDGAQMTTEAHTSSDTPNGEACHGSPQPASGAGASPGGAVPHADFAKMQIAQCRAQMAAARRQSAGGSEPSSSPAAPAAPVAPSASAGRPPAEHARGAGGNQVSVGTSMTNTLYPAAEPGPPRGSIAPIGGRSAPQSHFPSAAGVAAGGPRGLPVDRGPSKANAATAPRGEGFGGGEAAAAASAAAQEEAAVLSKLTAQRERSEACLLERLDALRVLQTFWAAGEVKKMLQHLGRLDDPSIAVDVVRADILRAGRIDLECALELLSILRPLLGSTYEEHALAALRAVSQLSLIFGPLIKSTRAIARDKLGVDLSAEARQQRCQACYEHFLAMRPRLVELSHVSGPLREPSRECLHNFKKELDIA